MQAPSIATRLGGVSYIAGSAACSPFVSRFVVAGAPVASDRAPDTGNRASRSQAISTIEGGDVGCIRRRVALAADERARNPGGGADSVYLHKREGPRKVVSPLHVNFPCDRVELNDNQ